jgi:hypothetical protein
MSAKLLHYAEVIVPESLSVSAKRRLLHLALACRRHGKRCASAEEKETRTIPHFVQ